MDKPYQLSDWDGTTLESLSEYLADYVYRTLKPNDSRVFIFYVTDVQMAAIKSWNVEFYRYFNDTKDDLTTYQFRNGVQVTFKPKAEAPPKKKKKTGYGNYREL